MSRFFLIAVLLAAALLAAVYAGLQHSRRSPALLPVAATDPVTRLFAASLDGVDGKSYAFASWQGGTLVVNFWATWCPPCRDELPAFSRLQGRYLPQGVHFVGIALDAADNVRAFAETHSVSYPLLIGGSAGVDLARQLGNSSLSLPFTLVINAQRELLLVRLGPLSESELDRILQQTLTR